MALGFKYFCYSLAIHIFLFLIFSLIPSSSRIHRYFLVYGARSKKPLRTFFRPLHLNKAALSHKTSSLSSNVKSQKPSTTKGQTQPGGKNKVESKKPMVDHAKGKKDKANPQQKNTRAKKPEQKKIQQKSKREEQIKKKQAQKTEKNKKRAVAEKKRVEKKAAAKSKKTNEERKNQEKEKKRKKQKAAAQEEKNKKKKDATKEQQQKSEQQKREQQQKETDKEAKEHGNLKGENIEDENLKESLHNNLDSLYGEQLYQYQRYIQKEVERVWRPPLGVRKGIECHVVFWVDLWGKVEKFEMIKPSGVLIYDLSVSRAADKFRFDRRLWGKQFTIVFRQ